jgi:geranylgeranyl pyrophosphate synthase
MSMEAASAFRRYWRATATRIEQALLPWVHRLAPDAPAALQAALEQVITGGKYVRGSLLCLMAETLGADHEQALKRALAVEGVQAASLIHDDFIDQDRTRRQRQATWTVHGARRAVLLGDVLFAGSIQCLAALGGREAAIIADTIATVAQGAYQEATDAHNVVHALRTGAYRPQVYERILHLKTAALFGTALRLGALAAHADEKNVEAACIFGLRLGEAYQIRDDLDDLDIASPRQMKAALPVLLYFCPEHKTALIVALEERRASGLSELLGVARMRMMHAIAERQDRALRTLAVFPASSRPLLVGAVDVLTSVAAPATPRLISGP